MDQETKEYLDRKIIGLVRRDDVEKMRQEVRTNFKQLREEKISQCLDVLQGFKEEWKVETERWRKEVEHMLHCIREEAIQNPFRGEEQRRRWDLLSQEVADLGEGFRKRIDAVTLSQENLQQGLTGIREEIGAALRLSFADLEKRITALESKIRALEKMIYR